MVRGSKLDFKIIFTRQKNLTREIWEKYLGKKPVKNQFLNTIDNKLSKSRSVIIFQIPAENQLTRRETRGFVGTPDTDQTIFPMLFMMMMMMVALKSRRGPKDQPLQVLGKLQRMQHEQIHQNMDAIFTQTSLQGCKHYFTLSLAGAGESPQKFVGSGQQISRHGPCENSRLTWSRRSAKLWSSRYIFPFFSLAKNNDQSKCDSRLECTFIYFQKLTLARSLVAEKFSRTACRANVKKIFCRQFGGGGRRDGVDPARPF